MDKFKIVSCRYKPFQGDGGEQVDYYWTKGVRLSDGVSIEWGGRKDHTAEIGQEVICNVEKRESDRGIVYREVMTA